MPKLTGTGRLADNLYLLAHDNLSGKPLLQPRPLGIGLAGALLAELLFAGVVWMRADHVGLTHQPKQQPDDDLGQHIRRLLLAEQDQHPIRDWLLFLGATAEENVAHRLQRAGYLTKVSSSRLRRRQRWVPADSDCAFVAPLIGVKAVMVQARSATPSDVVLTGLAVACGLGSHVLAYGPPNARHTVEASIRNLRPDLRDLVAQTQAAVDSALLSHRV